MYYEAEFESNLGPTAGPKNDTAAAKMVAAV
jgi:hypothetical protein